MNLFLNHPHLLPYIFFSIIYVLMGLWFINRYRILEDSILRLTENSVHQIRELQEMREKISDINDQIEFTIREQ
jgi:hypothetical protein